MRYFGRFGDDPVEDRSGRRRARVPAPLRLTCLAAALVLAAACATPVGVNRVDRTTVYRSLTHSVLTGSEPSLFSEQFLSVHGQRERYEQEPVEVLKELHGAGAELDPDTLFVLAELSFVHAERT